LIFICKSKKVAENISEVLNHCLYRFVNNICRYGNFNNIRILQSFPYCEKVEDVQKKFGLTDNEIEFMKMNI